MDDKKKQMLLFGVLGVLVLGAGSYFLFLRDTGPTKKHDTTQREARARERKAPTTKKETARRPTRQRTTPKAREDTGRVRAPKEKKAGKARQRKRGSGGTKKKKITPMA